MIAGIRHGLLWATLGVVFTGAGCGLHDRPSLVDDLGLVSRVEMAKWLIEQNRADIPSACIPATDYEWSSVRLEILPGGIMLWWCRREDPNHEIGPGLFYADGKFIAWAEACEVADVTGDGVADFVVLEHLPQGGNPGQGPLVYSIYPLGGDFEPLKGFAMAAPDGRGIEPPRITDFGGDGVAQVTIVEPLESLASGGWLEGIQWEIWKPYGLDLTRLAGRPATAVWSFKFGIARPILVFDANYEWRLQPEGFGISTLPWDESMGIPDHLSQRDGSDDWFPVGVHGPVVGLFDVPEKYKYHLFCNRQIVDGQRMIPTGRHDKDTAAPPQTIGVIRSTLSPADQAEQIRGGLEHDRRSLVDRVAIARRLIQRNRARIPPEFVPTTDYGWESIRMKFVPGGIMLWSFRPDILSSDYNPLLFYADGAFITWAIDLLFADVTGDGTADFVVVEPQPDNGSAHDADWCSVYPLGGDFRPMRGFALANMDFFNCYVSDSTGSGVAEVIVEEPAEWMAERGLFGKAVWERWKQYCKTSGADETGYALAVWSLRGGVPRPVLIFSNDHEWRPVPGRGFVFSTSGWLDEPAGIPERALGGAPGPWFKVDFDKKAGRFLIPKEPAGGGPFFFLNEPLPKPVKSGDAHS